MAPRQPNQLPPKSIGCASLLWALFIVAGIVVATDALPSVSRELGAEARRIWKLLPIPLILIGGAGLLSAAVRSLRAPVKVPDPSWLPLFQLAPGRTLAVTLVRSAGMSLAARAFGLLVWTGITALFVRFRWSDILGGGLASFLIAGAMGIVGLLILFYFIRECMVRLRVPETRVELSRMALRPGDAFEVLVSQGGWFHLTELRVRLVCEEEVEYREGTNTRTESAVLVDELLERQTDVEVSGGRPWMVRLRGDLPEDAMHSFRSRHNRVTWKLIVKGEVRAWPDFEREYALPVVPHGLEGAVQQALAQGEGS